MVSGSGARRDSNKPWEKSLYIYIIYILYISLHMHIYIHDDTQQAASEIRGAHSMTQLSPQVMDKAHGQGRFEHVDGDVGPPGFAGVNRLMVLRIAEPVIISMVPLFFRLF